jgi:hypothetical protein
VKEQLDLSHRKNERELARDLIGLNITAAYSTDPDAFVALADTL